MKQKSKKLLSVIILFFLTANSGGYAKIKSSAPRHRAVIKVYYNKELGKVNKQIFGNNFLGYDPVPCGFSDKAYLGLSDYGDGVWDPKRKEPVKTALNLAKDAGITIVRFPGGCGSHHYDWKKATGSRRRHFLFGIDEFLKTCQQIGAEPVITISYFTGDERDAADLVQYLNRRVRYFEIGNEVWHGDHQKIKNVTPQEYAEKYLKYYEKMKSVDPTIKIGVILFTNYWNEKVLDIVKDKLDFGILHIYPSLEITNDVLGKMNAKDIFRITLMRPVAMDEYYFQKTLKILKEKSGRDVPLAITEYNGGFVQEKPVPYRHCLGTALLNAELLRIFMKPEHNILMANYWDFIDEYWGMIKSKESFIDYDYKTPLHYIKRPNYYVYELYKKYFGDILIDVDTAGPSYTISKSGFMHMEKLGLALIQNMQEQAVPRAPRLTVNASKDNNSGKLYIMVVNKDMDRRITAVIKLIAFSPAKENNAWILNGPSIDSTNEKNPNSVRVRHKKIKIENNPFKFTFQPHSLTAIEITKKQ